MTRTEVEDPKVIEEFNRLLKIVGNVEEQVVALSILAFLRCKP